MPAMTGIVQWGWSAASSRTGQSDLTLRINSDPVGFYRYRRRLTGVIADASGRTRAELHGSPVRQGSTMISVGTDFSLYSAIF
jgi:hypothetical protein